MLVKELLTKGFCTSKSTKNMSRAKWLETRKSGIGGSDSGAIMGLNKWASPLTVYFSKKGEVEEFTNSAIEWGVMAEDAIRRGIAKQCNLKIEKVPYMFRSLENPFMIADLDGLVLAKDETDVNGVKVQGIGGLEIKTTTRFNNEFKDDEIPDSYYCQVQHYMAVTGLDWFILAVMIDKVGGKTYVIPRNEAFIEKLIESEKVFWCEFVEKDIAPMPSGIEREMQYVSALPMVESIVLSDECEEYLKQREAIESTIKELKAQSDAFKTKVLLEMAALSTGDASEKTVATCKDWKITYSTQKRRSADIDALENDGLAEKYVSESISRVVRITRVKSKTA